MKTAHQARLESCKYSSKASDQHTLACIKSIEDSIDRSIRLGLYEAPIDMYTHEALDYFIKLEYTFRTENGIRRVNWDYRV